MFTKFAQVTGTPTSGASNAEDFQPTTQNPQAVGSNLQQQDSSSQSTSSQDILGNQDARIIVPTGNPAPAPPTAAPVQNGFPWPLFIVCVGAFIVAVWLLIRRKNTPTGSSESEPDVPSPEPISIKIQEQKNPAPPKPHDVKKPKPKRSKSKRKKSRK